MPLSEVPDSAVPFTAFFGGVQPIFLASEAARFHDSNEVTNFCSWAVGIWPSTVTLRWIAALRDAFHPSGPALGGKAVSSFSRALRSSSTETFLDLAMLSSIWARRSEASASACRLFCSRSAAAAAAIFFSLRRIAANRFCCSRRVSLRPASTFWICE